MSGDSFSELIKTEKQAAEIISGAKEKRKVLFQEQERELEEEIEKYRESEQNRIRQEQQQQETAGGSRDAEEEQQTQAAIKQIEERAAKNMDKMVQTLVNLVSTVA